MALPIPKVVFTDRTVNVPREEMENRPSRHVVVGGSVGVAQQLLSKRGRALSLLSVGKISVLAEGEIAGKDYHEVQKPGFGFGIA